MNVSHDDVRRYRDEGFLVVRDLLTPGEIGRMSTAIDDFLEQTRTEWENDIGGYGAVFVQLHQASIRQPRLRELALHPRLAAVASALGEFDRPRVFLDQVICKMPGAEATRAHQDEPFLSFDDARSLNCWIAFDEVTPQNGCLEYFVGSHRLGSFGLVDLDTERDLVEERPDLGGLERRVVTASPGDAVFHGCRTVHQAAPNHTDSPRRAFSIQYMPQGVTYNGWVHPFLAPYGLRPGDVLDLPCLPEVPFHRPGGSTA